MPNSARKFDFVLNCLPNAEKAIVLNLLSMVAAGEIECASRPPTRNVRYSYWSQPDSLEGSNQRHSRGRPRSLSCDAAVNEQAEFRRLPIPGLEEENPSKEGREMGARVFKVYEYVCMCMIVYVCTYVSVWCIRTYMRVYVCR